MHCRSLSIQFKQVFFIYFQFNLEIPVKVESITYPNETYRASYAINYGIFLNRNHLLIACMFFSDVGFFS